MFDFKESSSIEDDILEDASIDAILNEAAEEYEDAEDDITLSIGDDEILDFMIGEDEVPVE